MTRRLHAIQAELLRLAEEVRNNKELPLRDQAIDTAVTVNLVRRALGELDTALHARHNERHPIRRVEPDLSPTQPLDAATRAEIDATP